MKTVTENNFLPPKSYVVEVDGKISSVYGLFVEAVKAGMELKQKFPHSHIKVHDLHQTPVPRASNRGTRLQPTLAQSPNYLTGRNKTYGRRA